MILARRSTLFAVIGVCLIASVASSAAPVASISTDPPPRWGVPFSAKPTGDASNWMYKERAFPDRAIPEDAFLAAVEERDAMQAAAPGGLRWRPLGPRPIHRTNYRPSYVGRGAISGRVTSLANHPKDPSTAYLGSAGGGVWKTTDGGKAWTPLTDDESALNIGAVAIDPARPATLYAGTGEANAFYFSPPSTGVLRSTDAGRSWERIGEGVFSDCFFADMAVAPTEGGSTVFAATTSGYLNTGTGRGPAYCDANGIWRSPDGVETWTQVLPGTIWDLELDPKDPQVVYAAASGVASYQFGGAVAGIFKSIDGGNTWVRLVGGLPPEGFTRAAIAVAPSDPNRVYAAFVRADSDTLLGVWTSTDGGVSWVPVVSDRQPCTYQNGSVFEDVSQCFYDLAIDVDPKDPGIFYVGGIVIVRYSLADLEAELVGDGPGGVHVDQHAFSFDAAGRFWVGNDGGVYRSSTRGDSFKNLTGTLALTQFYSGISGSLRTRILGGSQDNGTAMYTGGRRWTGVNGGDGGFSAIDPRHPRIMFATSQNLYIVKSVNGGWSWTRAIDGISTGEARDFIAPMVMDPLKSRVLYAGTTKVYRTTNRARSWTPISPAFGGVVTTIARPSGRPNASTIWAGTVNGGLWLTTQGGQTWTDVGLNGLPSRVVTDVAFVRRQPKTAYVTLSGYGTPHVFMTSDLGQTWKDISSNLPNSPANAITLDERSNTLYVATDVGLFSSTNGGGRWRVEARGLPNTMVMDLMLDRRAGKLIAATHGRGMFAARL